MSGAGPAWVLAWGEPGWWLGAGQGPGRTLLVSARFARAWGEPGWGGGGEPGAGVGARLGAWESYLLPRDAPNIRIHASNRSIDMRPTTAYMHPIVS